MIAVLAAAEVPAPRVILCRVSEKPRVIELAADPDGGYTKALEGLLGDSVAHFSLLGGVRVFCDRDGLIFGLALARRALAMSPWQPEITLHFDGGELGFSSKEWPVSGDFLLARVADDGGLVDLTEADLKHWMFWLGFDYIMNR